VVTPYEDKEKIELILTCITAQAGLQRICCSENGWNMKRIPTTPCSDNVKIEITAAEPTS
jgi:hypothetical protein